MHDPFPSLWRDKLCRLPALNRFALPMSPNTDCELLTCIVCRRGEKDANEAPEWLVTMRNPGQRVVAGLHEACRARTEKP